MGHIRMGSLPDTQRWRKLVGLIAEGGSVEQIATSTMEAADRGLRLAYDDPGLGQVVWLLAKVALAAREERFGEALSAVGIRTPSAPGVFDVVTGFSEAIDAHLRTKGRRSDIGEMAQHAAVECLTRQVSDRASSLFGVTSAEVQQAVAEFSTKGGFSSLAYDFFSRFTQRFLTYHLGRELSNHVGPNRRFASPSEHNEFVAKLTTHCREAALIVREFSGGWYSKAKFENGISKKKARDFTNYALKKLRDELRIRGQRDAK